MQATLAAARLPLPITAHLRILLRALLQRSERAAAASPTTVAAAESTVATSCDLGQGRIAWIAHPAGRTVTCEAGALWVTFDGQQLDVVLKSGQSYYCRDDARMAVYAVAPSRFRMDPAC